ncbi:MAG: hypothetical protein KBT04_05070 [Bacteroidales bacterium]|nr:hypothetical protein [Candidatus Colimorpha onthohippi]
MDKKTLIKQISHCTQCTQEEWQECAEVAKKYPYCAVVQMLSVVGEKAWRPYDMSRERLPKAEMYVPDTTKLRNIVMQATAIDPTEIDIIEEINAYQAVSFKTAPKSVLLTNFLENEACENDCYENSETRSVDELGKKSIEVNSTLITETMAVIYEQQGKNAQAIDIYEKLMVLYPEKRSTFAERIALLKSM